MHLLDVAAQHGRTGKPGAVQLVAQIDAAIDDVVIAVPNSAVITLDESVALTTARDIRADALKLALKLTSSASGRHALITPDFSPLGASGYHLTLLSGGTTVYSGIGPVAGFDIDMGIAARVTDSAGRQVRLLPPGALAAGAHQLRWDGRDTIGRRVPAGVYLVHGPNTA